MKKLIAAILLLLMMLSFCACDSGKGSASATGSDLSWDEIMAQAEEEG